MRFRVRTVRENQGKMAVLGEGQGKSGNIFCGLEEFIFSKQNQRIFTLL